MKIAWGTPPYGTFKSVNIITPHILGYAKLRRSLGWAELSEGDDMNRKPIFGVTVRRTGCEEIDRDLSKLCATRTEAESYIASLS